MFRKYASLFLMILFCVPAGHACSVSEVSQTGVSSNPDASSDNDSDPNDGKIVRTATFNVHNFFDKVCDSGKCAYGDYEKQYSDYQYNTKLSRVADGIWKLDADIILLQEIETESVLLDIQKELGADKYPGAIFGGIPGYTAYMNVGILTRGRVTHVETYRSNRYLILADGSKKRMARELLQTDIVLPNGAQVTAFTTHFISKASDPDGVRRLPEAEYTHEVLVSDIDAHPGRFLIFGGDLNDTPDSAPIHALDDDGRILRTNLDIVDENLTTWHNEAIFDYLYYPAEFKSNFKSTMIYCDANRANGYYSSDHCAVKATFILP